MIDLFGFESIEQIAKVELSAAAAADHIREREASVCVHRKLDDDGECWITERA
jgi:hypothetical protein